MSLDSRMANLALAHAARRGSSPEWYARAAGFFARGFSNQEVATEVHRSVATIERFKARHRDLIRAAAQAMPDAHDILDPMLPKAAETYHLALDKHDTVVARDVLDRLYGKPVITDHAQQAVNVNITFVDRQLVVEPPER